MSRLLSAQFARLFKNRTFWMGAAVMAGLSVYMKLSRYLDMSRNGWSENMWAGFFYYTGYIGILSAVFCSQFIGTDHHSGMIRSQIVTGHTRKQIYLSSLIVCGTAGLLHCMASIVIELCLGLPLMGAAGTNVGQTAVMIFGSFVLSLAFTGIYTCIAMLNQSKTAASVACILTGFFLLFGGTYIASRLSEPESWGSYFSAYVDENGEMVAGEQTSEEPNPYYLRGSKRQVYDFLDNVLPYGQALQYMTRRKLAAEAPYALALYSGLVLLVSTGIGLVCFERKDLR